MFSGKVYIIAPKESVEKVKQTKITINQQPTEQVEFEEDKFNIRYQKKTYFTLQKIEIKDIKRLNIQHKSTEDIYLSFISN